MNKPTQNNVIWLVIATLGLHMPSLALAQLTTDQEPERKPQYFIGTGQILAAPNNAGAIQGAPAGLKFEDAPLADVVGVILREIAKVDYVIHPPINGNVTLSTQGNVSADHAMQLLEAALHANGVAMARDTRGVFHIGRPDAVRSVVPGLRQASSEPLPPGMGAVVIRLMNTGAAEMATILRAMAPAEALVRVDTLRNLIVMSGTRPQIEGWLDIIRTFDVDLLKGMSVGVFPLKHVSTQDVEKAIRMISGGNVTSPARTAVSNAPGAPAAPGIPGGNNASNTPSALPAEVGLLGALRILPIANINSLLIVTPRASYLEEARRWIEKLDQPGSGMGDLQLFVYPVQNGNAKHLANVLNGLFGNGTSAPAANTAPRAVAPGLQNTSGGVGFGGSAGGFGTSQGGFGGAGQNNNANAGNQAPGVSTVTLNSGVRVMADEVNNAVLIYGSRGEYDKIQNALKRLDIPPTQVLIEASIIEVTLNDELKYGLQWVFDDKTRGGLSGSGAISTVGGGVLGGAAAGFSYTLRNPLGNVRGVINALADKSLVNVISSPSLMVMDNHTASIAVGTQQPIRSSETFVSGSNNVTTAIQYKDTGVTLSVTPSVNAGNMVTMQINQAVTDVGAEDATTGQRSFLQRQFNSKVAVRSGETLVLGGLIRDNSTSGKAGIPLLQDIPVLGKLFGANSKNVARTELLVVITPRVVRNDVDLIAIGQEMRDRMKGLPKQLPAPASFEPTVNELIPRPVPVTAPVTQAAPAVMPVSAAPPAPPAPPAPAMQPAPAVPTAPVAPPASGLHPQPVQR
jgi:general secretion pathway protein D